mgnify:FL=1
MLQKFLSIKELELLSTEEKEKYYQMVREYCNLIKVNIESKKISKKIISLLAPHLRKYKLEIYGDENIPKEDSAVFICNHSNSHDFFTSQEVFNQLNRNVTPFGASDCLNFLSLQMFKLGDVTLIDRDDRESSLNGLMNFTKKVIEGEDGIIFGEGTWNLHPIKPMQSIKVGGTQSAIIADKVVIPTIFEYVEVPDIVSKENEIYSRCIVEFGKPIIVKSEDNIIEKTKLIQFTLEEMRKNLWKKLGIKRESLDDINKQVYLNHTYMKKFKGLGFEYDSDHEFQYLLKDKQGNYENEYTLNENNEFVPGITHKK